MVFIYLYQESSGMLASVDDMQRHNFLLDVTH